MSLLSKKAVVLLLAAVAGLGAINAQAAKAKEKAATEKVSMLDGKFTFVLPKGFVADPLPTSPSGATARCTPTRPQKPWSSPRKTSIPEGSNVKDNDGEFLDGSVSTVHRRPTQGAAGLQQAQRKEPDPERHRPWLCGRSTAPPPRAAARRSTPR